ncbi:MAG: pilin [Lachnospiraceae bacterium]|jgi:large-conductance mechanosensitive channel|nr:pilin [Lachnospiraceae bacterium]
MKKVLITLTLFLFLICLALTIPSYAEINTNLDIYTPNDDTIAVFNYGGMLLGVVQVVAIAVGVIFLIIIAIKYMASSSNPSEKATIKEKLIPYFIGAVLMFSGSAILSMIANFAQNM